jgi:D-threo-aldose 1-dehydrogenase
MNHASIKPPSPLIPERLLGRSQVSVTALGIGGAGLGNLYRAITDEAAQATLKLALQSGIGFIDTAPFYGFGLSERRIAEALRHGSKRPVLSTKVGRVLDPIEPASARVPRHSFYSSEPFEPHFDYSYDGVMRSYESSLARLGTERIDVLLCHDIGALTHGDDHERRIREFVEGGYRAMLRLREESAVGAIGLGVNEWEVCAQLLPLCDLDCVLLAGRYTLLEQLALDTLFPLCAQRQVSVIIGGPFNSGILATSSPDRDAHYDYQRAPRPISERVQQLANICRRFDVPLPAAALQFPLAHPEVAAVVPGCSSVAELEQVLEWFRLPIPPPLWLALKDAKLLHPAAPVPS